MSNKAQIIMVIIIAVLLMALVGLGVHVWHMHQTPASAPGFQPTVEMKETKDLPRVKEQLAVPFVSIKKKAVEDKVKELPKEITQNPDKRYTATAEIAPNKGKTDVVAVLDTKTGETTLVAKQGKQSFLGLPNEKAIGGGYGISTEGTVYDLHASWNVLRIWKFNVGPYVEGRYYPAALHDKARGLVMAIGEIRW